MKTSSKCCVRRRKDREQAVLLLAALCGAETWKTSSTSPKTAFMVRTLNTQRHGTGLGLHTFSAADSSWLWHFFSEPDVIFVYLVTSYIFLLHKLVPSPLRPL